MKRNKSVWLTEEGPGALGERVAADG
ncbi:hypothetical protein [Pseudomonas sp. FP2294]|nr:hypothetical protein [Pseudomonas sp. FP2294]WLH59945.1 hypothetical protein PSH73_04860 [Pseudomonas sp. FP2294]